MTLATSSWLGFRESHRFQIPEKCHWNDVRTKASNVGAALQHAMREIEKANPDTLYGVFGDAQCSNKERLSDALIKDLIEHFSKLAFGNENVNSGLLGDALIKKFADATNKKAGEFYTSRSVVRLMIDMLDPKEAETIYDPACGTGGMLLAAEQHVREQHGDVKRLRGKLYGQEKNLTTSSIARMNLFLHGIEDFQVVHGELRPISSAGTCKQGRGDVVMLEGASSIDGSIYFEMVGNAHDCSRVRRPRPQPSRDRVNLLFHITSRMPRFSDVSFKGQPHEFSTFAYGRHRQQRLDIRRLLKSQADPNRDLGADFWRLFQLTCHGRFRHHD